MTQAQEAQAGHLAEEQQYEVEGDGLVYMRDGKAFVRKQVNVNLFMNPNASNKFGSFSSDSWELRSNGWTHIGKANIEIQIPEELDVLQECLTALKAKKEEIQKEFTDKMIQVDRAMQELLALPAPVPPSAPASPPSQFDDVDF